jgi:hypothetical protein
MLTARRWASAAETARLTVALIAAWISFQPVLNAPTTRPAPTGG